MSSELKLVMKSLFILVVVSPHKSIVVQGSKLLGSLFPFRFWFPSNSLKNFFLALSAGFLNIFVGAGLLIVNSDFFPFHLQLFLLQHKILQLYRCLAPLGRTERCFRFFLVAPASTPIAFSKLFTFFEDIFIAALLETNFLELLFFAPVWLLLRFVVQTNPVFVLMDFGSELIVYLVQNVFLLLAILKFLLLFSAFLAYFH